MKSDASAGCEANHGKKPVLSERERDYLLRWKRVGPLLDAIRREELRRRTREEYLQTMEELWSLAMRPVKRTTSGLVEWNRLLRR